LLPACIAGGIHYYFNFALPLHKAAILKAVMGKIMRVSVCAVLLCVAVVGLSFGADAHASIRKMIDIPAQGLGPALNTFARDRDLQVVYRSEVVGSLRTRGARGELTVDEALKQLLGGTGLTYRFLDEKTVTVFSVNGDGPDKQPNTSTNYPFSNSMGGVALQSDSPAQSSEPSLRLSQNGSPAQPDNSPPTSASRDESATKLNEIIVTAQKRSERIQDVPIPVTALNAAALVDSNQLRLQDYFTSVPGFNVVPQASGSFQHLSIRGITTGNFSNPTVGVTVDDVPYGSSSVLGGGGGTVVPDIDPGDLARVEVLRGPQGTLYGASSMGGLVKYVTLDPATDALSGRVEAGTSTVYNGAELGYNFRGSVNVPISETLAVRASGFSRQDPGYIDNVQTGQRGVNEAKVDGGRLSTLWRPSQGLSLKLSALIQDTKGDGMSEVDVPTAGYPQTTGLGDLQQSYLRGTGAYDRKVQAYSATLTAKLGNVDLTSVSGYNINTYSDSYDVTYAYASLTQYGVPGTGFNGFGVPGSPAPERDKTNKFTQEVRLSAPIGDTLDWLLGAFYTHEASQYSQNVLAENPDTGAIVGQSFATDFRPTYTEYAAFADLTFHLTEKFDIQLGSRESHIKQTYEETDQGPLVPIFYGVPSPFSRPKVDTDSNAFTYLVTPRFKISPDLMVYARLASGYRPGGTNYSAGPGTPLQYNPDKTYDFELGTKAEFLNHTLSVDASIYYIDWKNIQISLLDPQTTISYFGNGSGAKSQGIELSVESRPLTGLTLAGWIAWDDATLTHEFPPESTAVGGAYGVDGDRLPYSSRFSGNSSLKQDFPLSNNWSGFVGAMASYVGDREGEFTPTAERQDLPAYTKTDLSAGAKYDAWTINLYVNNVADKRGVLSGGLNTSPSFAFLYIQPRTAGLSLVRTF
jgi:iron complex outermembrane recepter protein